MSTDKRWLEEGAPTEVARLLESAHIDEPTEAQLQRLTARVQPLLDAPPPGAAPPVASLAGKVLSAVLVLGVGVGLGVWLTRAEPPPIPLQTGAVDSRPVPAAEPPGPPAPAPLPLPPPAVPRRELPPPPPPRVTESVDEELELLQTASRAPAAEALTLVARHVERFPGSALAQEREVVAVRALVELGLRDDGRRRADAFRERWPTSSHLLKLEALLAEP